MYKDIIYNIKYIKKQNLTNENEKTKGQVMVQLKGFS